MNKRKKRKQWKKEGDPKEEEENEKQNEKEKEKEKEKEELRKRTRIDNIYLTALELKRWRKKRKEFVMFRKLSEPFGRPENIINGRL